MGLAKRLVLVCPCVFVDLLCGCVVGFVEKRKKERLFRGVGVENNKWRTGGLCSICGEGVMRGASVGKSLGCLWFVCRWLFLWLIRVERTEKKKRRERQGKQKSEAKWAQKKRKQIQKRKFSRRWWMMSDGGIFKWSLENRYGQCVQRG